MNGIIGHLISELTNIDIKISQETFLYLITNPTNTGNPCLNKNAVAAACAWDYIPQNSEAQRNIISYLKNGANYKKKLLEYDALKIRNSDPNTIRLFLNRMIHIIEDIDTYSSQRIKKTISELPETAKRNYNKKNKEQLLEYLSYNFPSVTLVDYIYIFVYWATLKTLPITFSFELNYNKQLSEFNEQVVGRYGVNSQPGRCAVFNLSESNIFAMYEIANMYYYGNDNLKKDLNKALFYLKRSAGISKNGEIDINNCNPLALWDISYMYRTYRKSLDLADADEIYEIESLTSEERTFFSIKYCKTAVNLNKCIPAYNLLGLISKSFGEDERMFYELEAPEKYFIEAAEQGYPYAYNNLAYLERPKIFSEYKNSRQHLNNYLYFLSKATEYLEPWSCKKLGQFYLTGEIELENNKLLFQDMINPDKARSYFELATKGYLNNNSAICFAYLIVYFPEKYTSKKALEQDILNCCRLNFLPAISLILDNLNPDVLLHLAPHTQDEILLTLKKLHASNEYIAAISIIFSNSIIPMTK